MGSDPFYRHASKMGSDPNFTLAFLLARRAARANDRAVMLRHVGRALELGTRPDPFLTHREFAAFHHDPELLALLDAHR